MKHIWGKSFFRCWHLCNVHAAALFYYFLRVHVQRFSERGGRVALCAGSTRSWCCPRCCLANHPSGIWWPMDWCWLRKSQGVICENLMFFWWGGGGGLFPMVAFAHAQYFFFLWLLLWYNCLAKSLFKSFSYFLVLCFWSGHYFLTKSCSNCYFVVVVLCLLLSSFFLLSLQQPC